MTEFAKRQTLHIAKTYKEIVLGESIDDISEMQKLLEEVYQKRYKDVLVVELWNPIMALERIYDDEKALN